VLNGCYYKLSVSSDWDRFAIGAYYLLSGEEEDKFLPEEPGTDAFRCLCISMCTYYLCEIIFISALSLPDSSSMTMGDEWKNVPADPLSHLQGAPPASNLTVMQALQMQQGPMDSAGHGVGVESAFEHLQTSDSH
jgi:hypothetical protein